MAEGLARTYAGVREKGTEIRKKMTKAGGFLKYGPVLMIILAVISGIFRIKEEGTIFDTNTSAARHTTSSRTAVVPQRQVEVSRTRQVTPTICDNQTRMEVTSTSWSEASHTPGCRLNWARSTHPGILLVEYHFSGGKRSMECPIGCRLDDSREVHTYRFRVKPGTGEKVVVLVKDIPPK